MCVPIQLHYKLNKPPKHKPFTVRCANPFFLSLFLPRPTHVDFQGGLWKWSRHPPYFGECVLLLNPNECCTPSENDLRPLLPEFCAGGAFGRSPSPRARTVLSPVARKRHNTAQSSPRSS